MERVTRIELALSAWEADVLPLNYTRERRPDYLGAAGARQVPGASPHLPDVNGLFSGLLEEPFARSSGGVTGAVP